MKVTFNIENLIDAVSMERNIILFLVASIGLIISLATIILILFLFITFTLLDDSSLWILVRTIIVQLAIYSIVAIKIETKK